MSGVTPDGGGDHEATHALEVGEDTPVRCIFCDRTVDTEASDALMRPNAGRVFWAHLWCAADHEYDWFEHRRDMGETP